ncbi:MAG: hypothetical protein WBE13_20665 [Candidatus Acidiferrum sp.]
MGITKRSLALLFSVPLIGCWPLAVGNAQTDDATLKPFVMNHRAGGSSPADLSFLNETPAGKDGFIHIQNGHLVTGNGKRILFWGVHFTDWSKGSVLLPPKEDTPMWAATLARYGVNLVRLHFLDLPSPRGIIDSTQPDTQHFDPVQLDRLDFEIAEFKKRGIYVDLNLNVGRTFKPGDGVHEFDVGHWTKGVTLYDSRMIELEKDYARQLLSHKNPYTNTEYRNEPAVALVEIVNENALEIGFRPPGTFYAEELTSQYNAWLQKMRGAAEVSKLRELAGVSKDKPVPLMSASEVASAPKERFDTEMSFYMDEENHFFQDMSGYLKNTLGVKVPIIGTADHGHSHSGYPLLASLSRMQLLDGHVYWEHPGSREPKNLPMVNDPLHSTVVQLSRTAFAGKPYTVSEFNHPFPNNWASEGIPILAAYGSLQDWDAIVLYTFEPKLSPDWPPYVGDPFDISLDPVRMTELATGALMFRRKDVRAARKTVERTYSREQVMESARLPYSDWPYFTPEFPLWLPLEHEVRIRSLNGPPTQKFSETEPSPIVSDTGELTWYTSPPKAGVVTVNTDRTQALIGFIGANPQTLKNLSADLTNKFASIVLSSMDSLPLAQSSRMLLTTGSRVANTGMKWNEAGTALTDQGGAPTLVEPVSGKIVLRNLRGATAVTVTALDGAGHGIGDPISAQKTADGWSFSTGEPVTVWYVITIARH